MVNFKEHWQLAQQEEMKYWDMVAENSVEFLRILYEKSKFLYTITQRYPQALEISKNKGKALEVGIGALGIGVASLFEPVEKWEVVGIDPISRKTMTKLPFYLQSCFDELRKLPLTYIEQSAEDFMDRLNTFDLVICYNVLDHTYHPLKIIRNCYDLLVPGGYFILGIDTLSLMSKLRKKIFYKKYFDKLHPFRFDAWQIERLIRLTRFDIVWFEKEPMEILKRVFFKARRLTIICQKPFDYSSVRLPD